MPWWKKRTKVTTDQMAQALAGFVLEQTNSLVSDLSGDPRLTIDSNHRQSPWFTLECLLFKWFLVDVRIHSQFGLYENAVREKLAYYLYALLIDRGFPREDLQKLHRHTKARFTEYFEAFKRIWSDGETLPFAGIAWRRIAATETRSPAEMTHLIPHLVGTLEALKVIAERYEVIS